MRFVLGLGLAVMTSLIGNAGAAELRLDKVLLSSGGVGYFEFGAEVEGDARLSLTVRLEQVDDVLKSIVVYDDQGGVGGIRLPGRSPLAQRFRDLPFGPDALDSALSLLNGLRGEQVVIDGPSHLEGRLLKVVPETVQLPDRGGTVTRHRVNVVTEAGLRQVLLEDVQTLRFADRKLQAQVDQALQDIAEYRAKDTRTLQIDSSGEPKRRLQVGYVAAAPLWKASYRLALAEDADEEDGGALLQGWAHLENMTGRDWEEVELTLSSGSPVTFKQALYQAYYVDRPEVPVEVLGRVMPRMDEGAVAELEAPSPPAAQRYKRGAPAKAAMAAEEAMADFALEARGAAGFAEPAAMAAPPTAAESREAAAQVLFTVPHPVSVSSGYSLMEPIVNRDLPAKRLALYQPDTHAVYPMDSVRLKNDGETALPPGVVTLYGRGAGNAYLGDARLDVLPAGDRRILSFALDRRIRIRRSAQSSREITRGSIVHGILHLTRMERQVTRYRIKSLEDRRLWIEHPLRTDWELVQPVEQVVEETADRYRIEVPLAADQEIELEVVEQRPIEDTLHLSSLRTRQVQAYARDNRLSPALRKAFEQLARLQAKVEDAKAGIERLEKRVERIGEDQDRIRRNMERLDRNADLYRRYVAMLDTQETILEGVAQHMEQEREALRQAEQAVRRFIASLDVE